MLWKNLLFGALALIITAAWPIGLAVWLFIRSGHGSDSTGKSTQS